MFNQRAGKRLAMLTGVLVAAVAPLWAQLPPSEQLKEAAAPFIAARSQPNDLTPADMLAYSVGISRAGHACTALAPTIDNLTKTPDELLAYAQLCLFGIQYQPAHDALDRYLSLAQPPERQKALLLMAKALLGLKDPVAAASQIFISERDYQYDAQTHLVARQIVLDGAFQGDKPNQETLHLCKDQLKSTLPLLESGKGLTEHDAAVSPVTLFGDAVLCVDVARGLNDDLEQTVLPRLRSIVQAPDWKNTANLEPMQSALARPEMAGNAAPIDVVFGQLVRAKGPLTPFVVSLSAKPVLLVPFTLWSPSAVTVAQSVHEAIEQQPIYLLTSWAANTGSDDKQTDEILDSLRQTALALPPPLYVLVVPDKVLQQFHADAFPAAIVTRDGVVRENLPLVGDASRRLVLSHLLVARKQAEKTMNLIPKPQN